MSSWCLTKLNTKDRLVLIHLCVSYFRKIPGGVVDLSVKRNHPAAASKLKKIGIRETERREEMNIEKKI